MKQIYYLAQASAENRFDDIFRDVDGMPIFYDLGNIPSLVAFIQRERAIINQDFLIIDLQNISLSVSHILNTVQYLRKISPAELIFIGEDSEETTQLFGSLSSGFRVRNLITDRDEEETREKVKAALLGQTSPLHYMGNLLKQGVVSTQDTVRSFKIPTDLTVYVAVAGALHRCGTTTQTVAIARLLTKLGFRTAIHDRDGTLTAILTDCYREQIAVDADGVHLFGLTIRRQVGEKYNAYVGDFGVLDETKLQEWEEKEISVLCTTIKPWELEQVMPTVALAHNAMASHPVMLASFATEQEAKELKDILGGSEVMVAPWRPDVWGSTVPKEYHLAFLPLVKEICRG